LHDLQKEMQKVGARTVDDFILDYREQREAAGGNAAQAGFLNTPIIVAETQAEPRYYADQNRAIPKKIDSHLVTFDCITCDKCIPVCPNDANFTYHTGENRLTYRDLEVRSDGTVIPVGDEKLFVLEKADQIANFADYCNHCGNCDTFCPEYDGPYLKKPNFYGSRRAFDAGAPHDGFLIELTSDGPLLSGRIDSRLYSLRETSPDSCRYSDGSVTVQITGNDGARLLETTAGVNRPYRIDMGRYYALLTLLRGITNSTRVHAVNTPLLAQDEAK
jgi:putative selenate reductase